MRKKEKKTKIKHQPTFAFIDASNLFYGGEKNLGWKIDYKKLLSYLRSRYGVTRALYFGGVEIHTFPYDYIDEETVPIEKLERHLSDIVKNRREELSEPMLLFIDRHLQRVRFYKKLAEFGYELHLKPVKLYRQEDESTKRKANCDVDMAFYLMKEKGLFSRALILSGDGDFLPVLKYLERDKKEIIILSRGERTAKEIRRFAGGNFCDFIKLEKHIKFETKK